MSVISLTVEGEVQEVDLEIEMVIHEPIEERSRITSKSAYWGAVWVSAQAQVEGIQAELEHWEAKALTIILKKDEKIAEWKAKAMVRAHAGYLQINKDLAAAREMANKSKIIHRAFSRKGDLLQAMITPENRNKRSAYGIGREEKDSRFDSFKDRRQSQEA